MALPYVVLDELSIYLDIKEFQAFCLTCWDYRNYLTYQACEDCKAMGKLCLRMNCYANKYSSYSCGNTICSNRCYVRNGINLCYDCYECQNCDQFPFIDVFNPLDPFIDPIYSDRPEDHFRCPLCNKISCRASFCIVCLYQVKGCFWCTWEHHQTNLTQYHSEYFAVHDSCFPLLKEADLIYDKDIYVWRQMELYETMETSFSESHVWVKCKKCHEHKLEYSRHILDCQ